jgi:hypothetical protein
MDFVLLSDVKRSVLDECFMRALVAFSEINVTVLVFRGENYQIRNIEINGNLGKILRNRNGFCGVIAPAKGCEIKSVDGKSAEAEYRADQQ